MKKNIFAQSVFVLLCAFVFSVTAFGQKADLSADLKKSFRRFNLVRIEARTAQQSLRIPTTNKIYELNLIRRDLRAPQYRAEETNRDGVRVLEKEAAVETFKGAVIGEPDSQVRLTINQSKIEGYFTTGEGMFYIEPAANYSKRAAATDLIVYQPQDFTKTIDVSCALEDKIERGARIAQNNFQRTVTLRVIELATEADSAFVAQLGGVTQANSEILSILNLVEGAYETELGLTFDVVFQHGWNIPDPFDQTTANAFLASFRNFWNANYPQGAVPRDAAHLFTARQNFTGVGLSGLGTICASPNFAYGFNGRLDIGTIKYVLTAHEIGHNLNAGHAEAAQGCDNTIMNATVNNLTPLDFCPLSQSQIANFVATSGGCLSVRVVNRTRFDFDGDGKADESVFRPSDGNWYLNRSSNGFTSVAFGLAGDRIVPADYDADGKTDVAVYRSGVWYRLKSATNTFDGTNFGTASDIPAPADFDGDARADIAVFRPSEGVWYQLLSQNNAFTATAFGTSGDVPVAADFDADGKADLNVFRPSNGFWYRLNSVNGAFVAAQFGQAGDKPLAADFDADNRADLAVFRPSTGTWYGLRSQDNSSFGVAFGLPTDVPTAADFDGDGKTDISVFRPSNGIWYRLNSSNNGFFAVQFGTNGDVSAPSFYIP